MNPTAIYSKTGKGVQEASGKTSNLSRPDRAVLSAIDGRATVADVAQKNGKTFDREFEGLIAKLDKEGFIREASPGVAPKSGPAAGAKKPGAAPAAPSIPTGGGGGGGGGGADLDFTSFTTPPASKPAAPAASKADPLAHAKAEAEAKRAREAEALRARMEAEAKAKADAAARAKAEADAKLQAAAKAKADAEAKAKADAEAKARSAREAVERAAVEAKAKAKAEAELKEKLEAERAKAEAERKAREELEGKALAETSDLKKRLEEEKKAREDAERKAEEKAKKEAESLRAQIEGERKALEEERRKEEEERKARKKREEDEERERKEEAERQRKAEEEERKARKKREEEEERKRKEEAERQRKAEEEERKARKKREEEEERARKKAREEEEKREEEERKARKKREEEEERARRKQREEEEEREEEERKARKKREKEEAKDEEPAEAASSDDDEKPAKKSGDSFGDSLLADLESFTSREEDDRKAKEEADRKEKEEQARRRQEEEERQAKEEEEAQARRSKEEEKARRKEEERREKEALEAKLKEEEERLKREEQSRKDEEEERKRKAKAEEQLAARATTARASEDSKDWERRRKQAMLGPSGQAATRKQTSWGKPVAVAFFVLLLIAIGVIHVLPLSTAEYAKSASAAFGRPVKIGGARMSLYNGVRINFDGVIVGEDVRVAAVRATPQLGSLFSDNKAFSRIELEGLVMPQRLIGDLLYGGVRGDGLRVENIAARKVKLEGPLVLPELDFDAALAADGSLRSAAITGPDNLLGRIAVKGSDIDFEINADGMPLPFGPEVTLSKFGMTGSANRGAMRIESWGGSVLDGQLKGRANVRWGDQVLIQGEVRAAALNAAVFAPALLSEGRTEISGRFTFNGPPSPKLLAGGRFEGNFTVTKGVLGSFDLSRAIQSQGVQTAGRTQFNEMTGQASYDAGNVSLRNVSIVAGALNAGASLEANPKGEISGRIVADVRSPTQTLRATLLLGGTVREPQVRK